ACAPDTIKRVRVLGPRQQFRATIFHRPFDSRPEMSESLQSVADVRRCASPKPSSDYSSLCFFGQRPLLYHAFAPRFAAILTQTVKLQQMAFDLHLEFALQRCDQRSEATILELDEFVAVSANNVVMVAARHQHVMDCRATLYTGPDNSELDHQ